MRAIPIVVGYGGGVNSLAMLVGMAAHGVAPDAIVFSDTRGEKNETYAHMREELDPWLVRAEFPPLIRVCRADFPNSKTGDASLEAECLRLGTLPSRAYGFGTCADKWKIDPFKWWAKTWAPAIAAWTAGQHVLRAIGYDAGEFRRVGSSSDKGFEKFFPLIDWGWDRERCVAEILNAGLAVPPKSACFYCPSSTKTEVIQLGKRAPDLFARAVAIEARALGTGRWSVKGLGRRFSWDELVKSDEETRAKMPESPVESCGVCVEGSDDA